MADYTSIDPNALLPGAPWTSPLAQAAFENPVAIAEGAAGAPRIHTAAMGGSEAGDNLLFGTGGPGVVYSHGASSELFIPEALFRACATCEVRFSAQFRRAPGFTATMRLRVYRNENVFQTHTTTSTSFSTFTTDLPLVAGDMVRISIEGFSDPDNTAVAEARDLKYMSGDQMSLGGI